MKKLLFLFLMVLVTNALTAQKKIVLQSIHCKSTLGPVMNYLLLPVTSQSFLSQLNHASLKYLDMPLSDTSKLPLQILQAESKPIDPFITVSAADTNSLHLYLTILEHTPYTFYALGKIEMPDSSTLKRIKSIFQFTALLVNHKKEVVLDKAIGISVSPGETQGIGIVSQNLLITQKGFTEISRIATQLLMQPSDDTEMLEIKAPSVFLRDDFLPFISATQHKTQVTLKKEMASFMYQDQSELWRAGEAVFEKIVFSGRNATKISNEIRKSILKTEDAVSSEFVFLRQEFRDVVRDKNYLLQLLFQISGAALTNSPADPSNRFPLHNMNYLLQDQDTVAAFSVATQSKDRLIHVYPNRIWNGYDTATTAVMGLMNQKIALNDDYLIQGTIRDSSFTIRCTGRNTLKEFLINDRLVCIAQGKFMPERFVHFDASLSPELLNQLFMIGFARFFE